MVARISQDAVEVLASVDSVARISQDAVEVLASVDSAARISQDSVEVLASVSPPVQVSQSVVETLASYVPGARVSQFVVETLAAYQSDVKLSKTYVQILHSTSIWPPALSLSLKSPIVTTNWAHGWNYSKDITVSTSGVNNMSTLTDFPLRVVITDDADIGDHARNDGLDIIFTSNPISTNSTNSTSLIFTSSGTFTVPVNCQANISVWGAGGAGGTVGGWTYGAAGGAGGAARGYVSLFAGVIYQVVVGGGGKINSIIGATGGGAPGSGNGSDNQYAGGGGGYSGIFANSVSQANAIIIAGGGGGGGSSRAGTGNAGGAGGGATGQVGYSPYDGKTAYGGNPGTQLAAGENASCNSANVTPLQGALQGGTTRVNSYGGGGGGGYWGGSGGGYSESNTMGGGGGGSGYIHPIFVSDGALFSGNETTPGDATNILRGSYGNAGIVAGNGTDGVVVINYTIVDSPTCLSYERYSFSIENGLANGIFWVKIPTIDVSNGATIKMFYGYNNRSAIDYQSPSTTWRSEYLMVAHLGGQNGNNTLNLTDSTGKHTIESNISRINPIMTTNTTPSGICSASSFLSAGAEAFRAFNNVLGDHWHSANTGSPFWLQYQFDSAKTISSYNFYCLDQVWHPITWKLQGSNNGSSWTDLDTQTGIEMANTTWYYYTVPIANRGSYLYYRFYVTTSQGGTYVSCGELVLFSTSESTPAVVTTTASYKLGADYFANNTINANYLTITPTTDLAVAAVIGNNWGMSAWVSRNTQATSNRPAIVAFGNNGIFWESGDNNSYALSLVHEDGSQVKTTINSNTWAQVVGQHTASAHAANLYKDSVLNQTVISTSAYAHSAMYDIGRGYNKYTWNGSIGEVRAWTGNWSIGWISFEYYNITNGQISYDQEQVLNYSAIIEPETQNITISNFSVSIFTDQNVIFQEEILSANLELFIVEISADKNVEIIVNSSLPIYSSLLSRTVKGTASKNVAKFDLISNLNSEINLFNSYSANTLNTYLNLYSPNVITDIDFTISLDSLNLYLDQNSNEIIYDSTIFPTTRNITTTIKPSQVKVSSKFTATTFNLSSSLKASFVYGIICSDTLGLSTSFNNPTIEVEFDQFVDVSISIPSQTVTSEVKLFSKHAVISATTFYLVLNVKTSIVKIGKVVVLNSLNAYLNSKVVCLSNSFAANKLHAFINLFDNDLINKILVESIVSNESFGNAIINQNQKVLLSGIISNESFGNATINQKVLLSSIDSQEVFYQASCLLVKNVIFIAKRQNIKLKIFNAVVKAKKTKTKCVTNKDKNTDITWCLENFKYEDQTWDLY